jgi:exosortase
MKVMGPRKLTYRDLILIVFISGLAIWVGLDAWLDMYGRAIVDTENGQAVFAPVVAFYLFWVRRSRAQFIGYSPSFLGVLVVIFGYYLLSWGIESNTLVAWHLGAIIMLIGGLLAIMGFEVIRQFAPALIALLFIIPTPGIVRISLAEPMQALATQLTMGVLDGIGVDAIRQGLTIQVGDPPINVAIGEACNGMRMVFALALVVFGFVFSAPFRTEIRIGLLVVSPLIALTCNIIRLVFTSIIYGFSTQEFADSFHWYSGLAMIPMALVMLVGIIRLLAWLDVPCMRWRLVSV